MAGWHRLQQSKLSLPIFYISVKIFKKKKGKNKPLGSNRIREIQKLTPIKGHGIPVFVGSMAFNFKLLSPHIQEQETKDQ